MPNQLLLSYDVVLKVILFGDSETGKTVTLNQYIAGKFQQIYDQTRGVEFGTKTEIIPVDSNTNRTIKLQIWDASGQVSCRHIIRSYFPDIKVALLFCDVTKTSTFENLSDWLQDFRSANSTALVFLVANKCDLETNRVVSADALAKWSQENGTLGLDGQSGYTEISVKTNENVANIFKAVAINGYQDTINTIQHHQSSQVSLSDELQRNGVRVSPEFLASVISSLKLSPSLPPVPTIQTIEQYISTRTGETGIQGTYSKEQKLEAARWVLTLDKYNHEFNVEFQSSHDYYTSQEFADQFLEHRGSLCQGGQSRLTQVFQNMLYPSNEASPITQNQELLNILKLYFAIGLLEEFKRKRNTFSAKCRYLFSELFGKVDSKAKSAAVDAIIEVLSGNSKRDVGVALLSIKNVYHHALGKNDGLTKLLTHIETTLDCFSDEMQMLAKSLEPLRSKQQLAPAVSGRSP